MPRSKKSALRRTLDALGRTAQDVQHVICDGNKVELFFRDPVPPVIAQSSTASPYARPAYVPPAFLLQQDVDDSGHGADAPIEAFDLIKARR